MRRNRPLVTLAAAVWIASGAAARTATTPEGDGEPAEQATNRALFAGRVLLKDGVTPVAGADLILTGKDESDEHAARTNRRGRFKIRLPEGEYDLRIVHGMEIYRAPSVYRVSSGVRNTIDFLLLPDFERVEPAEDRTSRLRRGPDPRLGSPVEVGTVVDVVGSTGGGQRRRWAELLGFLGSLIAVAAAAL